MGASATLGLKGLRVVRGETRLSPAFLEVVGLILSRRTRILTSCLERTKEALQELATRLAKAFQTVAGQDRRVKVVIRPYDVERSGWVSR
jgi:hypothetical protein